MTDRDRTFDATYDHHTDPDDLLGHQDANDDADLARTLARTWGELGFAVQELWRDELAQLQAELVQIIAARTSVSRDPLVGMLAGFIVAACADDRPLVARHGWELEMELSYAGRTVLAGRVAALWTWLAG